MREGIVGKERRGVKAGREKALLSSTRKVGQDGIMATEKSRSSRTPRFPRVGISACLLGERVRYDGGHKRDDILLENLEGICELVPVCPEDELGLGTPREPIGLVGDPRDPRLVGLETGLDLTERMTAFCRKRAGEMESEGIQGFILKSKSPSCGLRDLEVAAPGGEVLNSGVGFWAKALLDRFPGLPMEESDRLREGPLLEAFLERILAFSPVGKGGGPLDPREGDA